MRKSGYYVQNLAIICAITEEVNLSWKGGSIIENLKELLENFINTSSPTYYPPVENLQDLIYNHYTENNGDAPITLFRCFVFDLHLDFIQDPDPCHCVVCNGFFQMLFGKIPFQYRGCGILHG